MDKIKSLFKGTLATDPIQVIFWGEPTRQTYQQALLQFNSNNREGKKAIVDRIFKKMNRNKNPKSTLQILHFVDYILEFGPQMTLGSVVPEVNFSQCQSEKEKVAEKKFVQIYYKFLQKTSEKPVQQLHLQKSQLLESVVYCQIAAKTIIQIIRVQFILNHHIKHSKNEVIVRMISIKMLKKVDGDMKVLKQFVEKYEGLITQNHQFSFHINEIYEQAIFIAKNVQKLKALNTLLLWDYEFVCYELDKEKNKKIEKEMMNRNEEKKIYKSQKSIKSMPIIKSERQIQYKQPTEICEQEILLGNEEFVI